MTEIFDPLSFFLKINNSESYWVRKASKCNKILISRCESQDRNLYCTFYHFINHWPLFDSSKWVLIFNMKKIFTKFQISPILTLVLYIFHIISNISYYQLNFVWAWGGGGTKTIDWCTSSQLNGNLAFANVRIKLKLPEIPAVRFSISLAYSSCSFAAGFCNSPTLNSHTAYGWMY